MVKKAKKIWMDGKLVDWNDANVHILTHTLHYGLGVFEGVRCYKQADGSSAIFRLREHIKRLFESAHMYKLDVPFSQKEVIEASVELFKVNQLESGYLRPLIFFGEGSMGLGVADNPVRVSLAAWEWGAYLGEEGLKNGIRTKTSSFRRLSMHANFPKSKACGNYVNSILAKREAIRAGYEESLLLDAEGYLCEASGENIFIVKDGVVKTPPEGSPILKGITRDSILCILKNEGIPYKEERFGREDSYIADEVFLTGTAAEITPVREIDDRQIGEGKPGPVTKKVQDIFFEIVNGKNKKYQEWLTPIK